jgi:hypothetical protein
MLPFDRYGGMLHLRPVVAQGVAYLVLDTGLAREPREARSRDPRLFPARRVSVLPSGWVRAHVSRDVGGEQVLADVLFAPGDVLVIHHEWVAKEGPGAEAAPNETAEQRTEGWEASWQDDGR